MTMQILATVLNLPWNIIGFSWAVISGISKVCINAKPQAIVFNVRSFWWYTWLPSKRGVRAVTIGQIILLSPSVASNDFEHELVHAEQAIRQPFMHPLLYILEEFKHGGIQNKYEAEAYARAGNEYLDKQ